MNARDTIIEISRQKSEYNYPSQAEDLANSLDTISDDIYSESDRFIYELIQNADDAAHDSQRDLQIEVEFTANFVVISHNGRAFSEQDIYAVSSVGKSQKSENPNQTGYKGIGFKSVFGKSDCVYISSGDYCFRYDKSNWANSRHKMPWQIIPVWSGDDIPPELEATNFGSAPVSTAIRFSEEKGFSAKNLKQSLISLFSHSQVMLFLRNVTLIDVANEFTISRTKHLIAEKNMNAEGRLMLNAVTLSNNHETTNWIIGDFIGIEIDEKTKIALTKDEKAPKRLRETKYTNISFAAKIDEKGELSEIKENSLIFTYLPTKINKGFPFLVNADFLTNAPREGFHEDRAWNIWLFEQVGFKSIEWLSELAQTDYRYQIAKMVAEKFTTSKAMDKAFNEGFQRAINIVKFIPNEADELLLVDDTVIEKTGIDQVLGKEVVIEYMNDTYGRQYKVGSIANKKLKSTNELSKLGCKRFEIKDLRSFFESAVIQENLYVEDSFEIIKFFYEKWHSDHRLSETWKAHIPGIPFIFNEEEELCSPQKPIYFPVSDFEIELKLSLDVIHPDVFQDLKNNRLIKIWIKEIGIGEPTPLNIIKKIIHINQSRLTNTSDKSLEIVRFLFKNRNVLESMRFPKIQLLTTKGQLKIPENCYLSDFYDPKFKMEELAPNEDCFVSPDYVKEGENTKEWNLFFTVFGVDEDIKEKKYDIAVNDLKGRKDARYFNPFVEEYKEKHANISSTTGKWPFHARYFEVNVFSFYYKFFDLSIDTELIKILWQLVFEKNIISKIILAQDNCHGANGFWDKIVPTETLYFEWATKNLTLFPVLNGQIVRAQDAIIYRPEFKIIARNYLPILDLELPEDIENNNKIFNFRKVINLQEYLQLLSIISKEDNLGLGQIKETTERIGLIYRALMGFTKNYEKAAIEEWAKKNMLLSKQNNFIACGELHFLDIEHFELPQEVNAFVKIPKEVSNDSRLKDLLKLFGVKIINYDSLETRKINSNKESQLQTRLMAQMPLIALVVAYKEGKNYEEVLQDLNYKVQQSLFFKSQQLFLDCNVMEVQVFAIERKALAEEDSFYYTGEWHSPVTLYDLTNELCNFLEIKDISKELNVLLLVTFSEGIEWLESQKYDVSKVPVPTEETDIGYQGDFRSTMQKLVSENIGEVAERYVFKEVVDYFKEKYSHEVIIYDSVSTFKTSSVEVLWHRASGNPFQDRDITITENGLQKYIEVKATMDREENDSTLFFSFNEWTLMKSSKERYFVARVFNANHTTDVIYLKMSSIDISQLSD